MTDDVFYREYLAACAERDEARTDLAAARQEAKDAMSAGWKGSQIDKLLARNDALRTDLAAANALISKWDALINYQFSGSREAMSAMTECAQETAKHLYGPPPWPSRIDALLKASPDDR